MTIENSELIKVLDLSQKLLTITQVPLKGHKFSQNTFTQHQLFKLLVLKAYFDLDYRKFEDYLKTSKVPEYLGMKRIPHFTTLQKFAQRQKIQHLEKILPKFLELTNKKHRNMGLDATGFGMGDASTHYEKRIGRNVQKKSWLKANFVYDLDQMLILAVKFRKKARGDTKDVKALWNKVKHLKHKRVFADKAYDWEEFHKLIFESGRTSKIHLKNTSVPVHRTKGRWRKHMRRKQKNSQKGKRSLCETINSIVKRVYGSILKAKTLATMKIELLFKIITMNLTQIIKNIFCLLFSLLFGANFGKKTMFEFAESRL